MMDEMQKLKVVLQMLALPATGQVYLVEGCGEYAETLTQAFNVTHGALFSFHYGKLIPAQERALARLDDQLGRLCHQNPSPLCCEQDMRTNSEWRQVRLMARKALIHFKWALELPPPAILREGVCTGARHFA